VAEYDFNPDQHPRHPAGSEKGGEFAPKSGAAGLAQSLLEKGGFTYQPVTEDMPQPGSKNYAVSPYRDREQVIDLLSLTPEKLAAYVVKNADLLRQPDHYFGGWLDGSKVYLDVSVVKRSPAQAEALARRHKQLAYFDFEKMETVTITKEKAHGEAETEIGTGSWQGYGGGDREDVPGADRSQGFTRGAGAGAGDSEERRYADPPRLGRLPESALRYFRTKRFWVTGLVGKDLTKEMQSILLAGMKSGASTAQIVAQIDKAFEPFIDETEGQYGARLRTIVRTNVTDAYNQGVLVDMRSPDMQGIVKGMEYVAVLDDRTTELCEFLDGTWFRLDDARLDALNPPNHFNCRSVLSPVVEGQTGGRYINNAKFRKAKKMIPPGFGGTK